VGDRSGQSGWPAIADDLGAAPTAEQFLVTAYAPVFGALLLLAPGPTGGLVIAAPAGQGLGAACVAPNVLAMLVALCALALPRPDRFAGLRLALLAGAGAALAGGVFFAAAAGRQT